MPVNTEAVGKTYARRLRRRPREGQGVRAATGETNPLHLDVEAARAAGYADVVAPPMFAVVYSAPAVAPAIFDPEVGIELRAHGPRRPGVPLGPARRRRRRDHDDGVGQGHLRARRQRASTSSRRCRRTSDGETVVRRHLDEHRARGLTWRLSPGDEIPELQGHARQVPDRPLRGRLRRLQPDPHRRGVRQARSACPGGSCTGCGRWPRSRARRPRPAAARLARSA